MTCITVTWNGLACAICWALGVILAIADTFVEAHLSALAIALICIAAVRTVKGFLDQHAANWTKAYEIGREVQKVRRLH